MSMSTRLLLALGLGVTVPVAHAQFSWQTPVSGPWSTGTNWLGGSAPTNSSGASDVFIDFAPFALTGGPGNFTTTLDYSVSIRNLFSRANFTQTAGTLTLAQTLSQVDGDFLFGGGVITGGGITFNGSVSMPGSPNRTITGSQVTFNGPGSYLGGFLFCVSSAFNYGGVFAVSDGSFRDGVHNVLAAGTLRKTSGAGDFLLSEGWNGGVQAVNVAGTLEAQVGRIRPMIGGTHSGLFWGNGGTVFLGTGIHNLTAGTRFRDMVVIDGATVSVVGASDTLELIGSPEFRSGNLIGAGALIGTGTLRITGAAGKGVGGTLTNQADVVFDDGIVFAVNSTFTNENTMNVDGARIWRDGIFNNSGTLQKTGAGQAIMGQGWSGGATSFNNSGSVESTAGSLAIVTGGTHSGEFAGNGGTVDFNASTHVFDPGHALYSGVNLNTGTFRVPSDELFNCAGAVKFNGGTINQVGANPGRIGGVGSLDVEGNVNFSGLMRLQGTTNWNAGIISTVNSTYTNEGILNVNSASDWRDGILNNSGTIRKTSGGTTNFNIGWSGGPQQFNNSGTVEAQAGTLSVRSPGTQSGLFHGNGGQIQFPIATHTLNNGSTLRDNVLLNGATLTIPANQTASFDGATWNAGTFSGTGTLSCVGFNWSGTANLAGNLRATGTILCDSIVRSAVNSTFTNQGTIRFDGNNVWRDGILVNSGTLRSTSGTTTLVPSFSGGPRELRNGGQVIADASTINVHGTGNHTGSFAGSNGGTVNFAEGTHTMRSGSSLATGTTTNTPMVTNERVKIDGETQWQSSSWGGTGVVDGDTWRWTTGANKSLGGHLKCEANISHEAGQIIATSQQFTNRGTATIGDGLSWRDGVWFNEGTIQKIAGAGTSNLGSVLSGGIRSFTNTGKLLSASGTLRVDTTLTNYDGVPDQMNGGTYAAADGGKLHLPIGPVLINVGRFILDGPTSIITQSNGTTSAIATLSNNLGGLEILGGHVLNLPGPLANSGDVLIGQSSSIVPTGPYTQTGGITTVNGTLPVPIDIQGGILAGTGTANGGTVMSATIAPGNSTGTLSINGNLGMNSATLDVEVAGAGAGQFDRLAVSGTATITGGTLKADAAANSTVPMGTTVDVLTAGSRVGTFTTLPNPLDWGVTYGATFVRLNALRTIIGPVLVTGEIDLDGWLASYSSVPMTFQLRQGGSVIDSFVVNPNNDRTYSFSTRRRGSYDLYVVGPHWLTRKFPSTLNITDAGLTGINLMMINGDVDQDDEVGIGDFAILSFGFGTEPGDPGWDANADLNGDEFIDIGDFAILSQRFGDVGD